MELCVGLRVVRGPNWSWGDQDGGEGYVGTVVEVGQGGGSVVVQWDCGNRQRYRCGEEGKYDLRVFDSAPTGLVHPQLRCHGCLVEEIAGILWKCVKCFEYFLCTPCYAAGKHCVEHPFSRIDGVDLTERTRVNLRARSLRIEARGIFPGAEVVRGHNWRWGNQDGGLGMVGKVVNIQAWKKESARSVAGIEWIAVHRKNQYRVGHRGKVDLKCTKPGSGGYYYPEHLPVLGAPYEPLKEGGFAAGDSIKVELDPDVWKLMQNGHGGWNDLMSMFIGMIGTVHYVEDNGDLIVYFRNSTFHINPAAATKVDVPMFKAGDVVSIMEDRAEVSKLQKGHGNWNEEMTASLGQLGRVVRVVPNAAQDVQVSVAGRRWTFNSACLKPAPGENLVSSDLDRNDDHVNPAVRTKLRFLLETMSPEIIPAAVIAGDASILREYLTKCPHEVNTLFQTKSALHIAISKGNVHILQVLLEYGPKLEIGDDRGNTPLHYCANYDQDDAAKLLLDAGADINYKNAVGNFPLKLCTALGNYRVLRLLANHPKVNLHNQDIDGNTALHAAARAHRIEAVIILLNAGADPTLYNNAFFTPILEAARNGFYAGMEQFMGRFPEHVNMVKADDEHTALHIAAANDHLDIVRLLASMNTCNLNAKNHLKQSTPLRLVVEREHSRMVEVLVGYGADVNMACSDGHTPLHVVTTNKDMKKPTPQTQQLQRVNNQLVVLNDGKPVEPYVTVAAFLVQEGADTHVMSSRGVSPLQVCPPDIAALITKFASENPSRIYIGTLRSFVPHPVGKTLQLPTSTLSIPEPLSSDVVDHAGQPPAGGTSKLENTKNNETFKQPQDERDTLQQTTPQQLASNIDGHKPPVDTATTTNTQPYSDAKVLDINIKKNGAASSPVPTDGAAQDELCALCENPADVKFEPCGHIVMCKECADKAKRCPICKSHVKSRSRVVSVL